MPIALLPLLLACRGEGGAASTCQAPTLGQAWPAEGADPVSRSAAITVGVDGALSADDVVFTVRADGVDQQGQVEVSDDALRWTPSQMLPASAEVSWSLDACGSATAGTYRTGTEGEQVDPAALVDLAWGLDLDQATWIEPAGGQVLFGQLFSGLLMLGVQEATTDQVDLIGGAAEVVDEDLVQQDPCVPTFDFEPVAFSNNPYVAVGPTTLELAFQGVPVQVDDVVLSGAFSDGGETFSGGALSAELDAREIAPSVGTSAEALCELLESYLGLSCVACAADGEERCVALRVEDIEGQRLPGLRVVPNPDAEECSEDTGGGA
ncbi:hypothetical protein L6R53_23625 [Myxococcota bacterium]|nr:hypothetical protein [Myxococcota bacterium]